ncbi:hypothetical protein [Falsibacillus pallidus]|uniref:Uncharacterized protein n=1 Tax=Falsibacillus pallidus TaxID=493781 RepID=A0A370G3M1_9BACI|nr:hypothetical protein [Falsibacillus pallidus]RDI38477.1 hypothetical protein DFR59_11718 [Falsibacillus pallidus]
MTHVSYEQWMLYASDNLDESKREEYEDHLYECDPCMDLYMQAVKEQGSSTPEFDEKGIADKIMQEISSLTQTDNVIFLTDHLEAKRQKAVFQKPVVQYLLAAGMTVLLMSTGVFQSITAYVADYENSSAPPKNSVTKVLLDKTVSIVDKVEKETKEDK